MKQLYDWQKTAVARFVRAAYFAIVADCGVGKTLAAIRIAIAKDMPTIVIAPTHRLCEQWKNDILQDAGPDEEVWVYDKPTETKQGEQYREDYAKWLTRQFKEKNQKSTGLNSARYGIYAGRTKCSLKTAHTSREKTLTK